MANRKNVSSRKSPKAQGPRQDRRPSPRGGGGRPADDLAEINEQLLTEREELQRQTLESTEWKDEAERKCRALEGLARLTDQNPDPALRVFMDGTIQYRNPASLKLCRQWSPDDELQLPSAIQEVVAAAHGGRKVIRREMTFGEHTYLVTASPADPPQEDFVNVFVSDITVVKQAEGALRELNTELEHRTRQLQKLTLELVQAEERERRRMAEVLHDDLQQIVAAAKFNLSVMRNRIAQDPSLQDLGAHIDDMLKAAIEKSRSLSHELSPAVLHRSDLTEALRWLARQIQTRYGLVVHVHAHAAVELQSDIIIDLLYRAAQELLFNVVKHARVSEASVRVRRLGAWVCLSVSDRGGGFEPQELRTTAGFGLLSIRERIELLGGCVKIRSAKGKGSTFFVVVPDGKMPEDRGQKTEDGRQAEERAPSSVLRPRSSVLRVLLADDHRIVRESLRLLLQGEHDVEIVGEAAHGREAVDLALRLEPDVVIMDVSMPLIDGDVATLQIKKRRPRIRVIALSTYNEPETRERMYRAGAESYVLKTASAEELLAAIRRQEPNA